MQHKNDRFTYLLLAGVVTLSLTQVGCGGDGGGTQSEQTPAVNPAGNTSTGVDDNNTANAIGGVVNTSIGSVFVSGDSDRTLYTFANDTDNVSNCSGDCLENWPAATAATAINTGQFSTIERNSGTLQWVFKQRPLYFYQGDAASGEVNGEGLGGVWSVARPDPIATGETSLGTVLVGKGSISNGTDNATARTEVDGLTLYTFRNDTANSSVCNDQCAIIWPPLYADNGALPSDDRTLVNRADGTVQWALAGQPLYFYQGDSAAGDTNGNGVGGVWDVARPEVQ